MGVPIVSYRSDMEAFAREARKRKKFMSLVLKITVIALAAAVLAAGIGIGVLLATGELSFASAGADSGEDTKKPVIRGPEGNTQVVYTGDAVSYKSFVQVSDNSGNYELTVDNSQVNLNVVGTYTVTYTATDGAGNQSTYTLTLVVKNGEYSDAKLMALVEAKATALGITKSMSKVEQVRKIYSFVNGITWQATGSNTPSQQISRENWELDWVEEAIRTLDKKKGDCYSYYSVSRAFFEYFEIENLSIKRASDQDTKHGTHFWNVVNVGTESDPQWYYYDATRLKGTFADGTHNGCLMTESKMNSYTPSDSGSDLVMYRFEKWNGFPTISTKELD